MTELIITGWGEQLCQNRKYLQELKQLRKECIKARKHNPLWDVISSIREVDKMIVHVQNLILEAENNVLSGVDQGSE